MQFGGVKCLSAIQKNFRNNVESLKIRQEGYMYRVSRELHSQNSHENVNKEGMQLFFCHF